MIVDRRKYDHRRASHRLVAHIVGIDPMVAFLKEEPQAAVWKCDTEAFPCRWDFLSKGVVNIDNEFSIDISSLRKALLCTNIWLAHR